VTAQKAPATGLFFMGAAGIEKGCCRSRRLARQQTLGRPSAFFLIRASDANYCCIFGKRRIDREEI